MVLPLVRSAAAVVLFTELAFSQGTLADYQRAQELQSKPNGMVINVPGPANWIGESHHFWYWKTVRGGTEFVLVDAVSASKKPAFDHARLAAAINSATNGRYTPFSLPFAPPPVRANAPRPATPSAAEALTFREDETAIQFGTLGSLWKCTLTDYVCSKVGPIPREPASGRGSAPEPADTLLSAPFLEGGDPVDGLEPQAGSTSTAGPGRLQTGCAPLAKVDAETGECRSFNGEWIALIQNFNVFLRRVNSKEPAAALSQDGSEGNYYTLRSIAWSPDSKKLVAYRVRPGFDRQVHYVESSPPDQLQPKHSTIHYRKPGDALDIAAPMLFDVASRKQAQIDNALFPNAYSLGLPIWWKDNRGFTFEYNQRGHQAYRVIEVDALNGTPRALIDERSKTFFYYNLLGPGLSAGKRYRHDVNDGKEIVWASERDGWEHLYLYDGATGKVKNQITRGNWILRNVDRVDDQARQVWFEASGMRANEDPYFPHYYRINFDGTGLIGYTEADGYHSVSFSADRKYYVDSWSRVDLPPKAQLRRVQDRKVILDLEQADAKALLDAGVHYPEPFVAKGRDGETDIWGVIIRPTNFDEAKRYPVIEQIYAGPQGSFVPKTFVAVSAMQSLAELGFIVVQIDGMGTNNRSKAFHDIAFKNLGDAGFPDRILWHKAVAAKYPFYDISRVGIYGTSAGGQNSLGGMLFHPEFYKVAVTNSGCHDNRMDKIWWNEQWMSWPLGPQYAASSNVDNAFRLQGKVLVIIPEMDTNVDPSSSLQVVNSLVRANKHFDMLYIPGQNHGTAVLASQHYLQDYFVHNLLGVEPPDWNRIALRADASTETNQ